MLLKAGEDEIYINAFGKPDYPMTSSRDIACDKATAIEPDPGSDRGYWRLQTV